MDRRLENGGRFVPARESSTVPMTGPMARFGGAAGGLFFAVVGAWMGSMNTGWFDLRRDSNALLPLLGLGLGLVVAAWAAAGWPGVLWRAGGTGRGAVTLLSASLVVYVLSWMFEFAIVGTLALALGLVLLAVTMWRRHLSDRVDRVLVTVAAAGSLTWNTETSSAFILVGVGAILVVLCLRLGDRHGRRRESEVPG